jgi:AcrR family transcriptional regulator
MAKARSKQQRDRHQEILEAAAQVITDRGLAETRIQDIAARCGVSPGLILYYFDSKDRLLVEALTFANDQFYLRLSRELRRMTSAKDRLGRLIDMSVPGLLEDSLLDEWALWLEIWVRALRDPEMAKEREALDRRWVQSIADVIRFGRQTGEFPPGRHNADDLAMQIGAVIDGLAIQVLLNDTLMTPRRMQEIVTDVATRLVGYEAAA